MAKYVKKVAEIVRRAQERGSARDWPYEAAYSSDRRTFELFHYGTMILQSENGNFTMGGYSNSDRDAISTALSVLGSNYQITGSRATAKRAMKQGQNVRESGGWSYW